MPRDIAGELAMEFRRLSNYLLAGGTAEAARHRLVDLAAGFVPGCDLAAVTVRPPDAPPHSAAHSSETAQRLDHVQYTMDEGPCLEAARTRTTIWSPDLRAETRWPAFCAWALEDSPVRGVLSYHLLDDPAPTALNLYSNQPDVFGEDEITRGALFATHAAVLMAHADSAHRAATLGAAVTTSRQIGAAIGILMTVHKVTEPEAFALLRSASNDLNRKLYDIAQDVSETGDLPPHSGR